MKEKLKEIFYLSQLIRDFSKTPKVDGERPLAPGTKVKSIIDCAKRKINKGAEYEVTEFQTSRFIVVKDSTGQAKTMGLDEIESFDIADVSKVDIIDIYKKAKTICNTIESDAVLKHLVSESKILKIAERLATLPDFDIARAEAIMFMLKAEILDAEEPVIAESTPVVVKKKNEKKTNS
jgi:hypothetical protein